MEHFLKKYTNLSIFILGLLFCILAFQIQNFQLDASSDTLILENDQDLKEYIIAPSDIKIGDKVISSLKTEINSGNAMKIKNIPTGTSIHNIELKPGRKYPLNEGIKFCYLF